MNSQDVLKAIEEIAATGSRLVKEGLVTAGLKDALFRQVVKLATDPFVTFGITPTKAKTNGIGTFTIDTPQPWIMLYQLSSRQLTGNEAKVAVARLLEDLEPASSELLLRILRKDLRAGFSKNTINRVMPGTIPTFDVMLSKPYEEKRIKVFPVGVEPKLDGYRTMFLVKEGQAKAFSRVGNHFPAYDHLSEFMWKMVKNAYDAAQKGRVFGKQQNLHNFYWQMLGGNDGPKVAIDAETLSGSFNETGGAARRKSEAAENVVVHIFDALPYKLITGDNMVVAIPFKIRRAFVDFIVSCKPEGAPFVMTDLRQANSHDEIMEIYAEHRAAGLEGAMVKPLGGFYDKKKGFGWMKIKAEETEDLRITGWFEGKVGTKLEGKFGGFIVDRAGVEVRVGGGFSDAQREEFLGLARIDDCIVAECGRGGNSLGVINRLIEVEYHEVTPDGSLRHPRFVRWRDDKDEQLKDAA